MISKWWAVLMVLLAAVSAWKTSGEIGYKRGREHEFNSCTVAFSRERLITESNCDFTSASNADSKWMLKMLTRNNDF